ncbi:hypothetical protein BU16DRAFT_565520 [Lophium mytilinum]|uniref:TMEM1 family protein-like protein n=1 Tax=Lophium mytilinum TaxID=390894 RepID=A0A6A6QIE9_9PEZI|nr:hypothetical protein BU16DRAFT_565520 [Lophium mytilinum]
MESSKVTVEYHDPSGVFPLLSSQLTSRLPLRNLHWKSPSRPLRSIDSLHVDLVPSSESADASANLSQPGQAIDGDVHRPNSEHGPPGAVKSQTSSELLRGPAKERRHQIPGLRRTPYLKVYLLRCDDSETYKASSRKLLREWVRIHTPPSQSSSSASAPENHDAFEWLILHVVVPDTPAASQPRGSGAAGSNSGTTEKSGSTSRWTRGSTTIFEKIRADFNHASKSAPDRVAQVRLQKDVVPPHMLPSGSAVVSSPYSESPQEQNNAWNDVIAKFKTLILLSFNLRVGQYEEDIRDKESQRSLPGWNFCTFFILKEGLARGFESVGLVEDALMGYDELSFGLDSIIRDQANDSNQDQGGAFFQYTKDLQKQAALLQKHSENSEENGESLLLPDVFGEKPLNAVKKNYRESILSSNISVFDFRCYIFSRQLSLLLRLGNAYSARTELAAKLARPSASVAQRSVDDLSIGTKSSTVSETSEDLLSLSELCLRSLSFVTSVARVLRDDLNTGSTISSKKIPRRLVDNLVSSWTFAVAQQILDETATSSLPVSKFRGDATSGSSGKMLSYGGRAEELKANVPEPKTMIHPSRSSSLSHRRTSNADPPYAHIPPSGQVVFDHGRFEERPPPISQPTVVPMKSGIHDLAGNRARLYIVQRRILEHIGQNCGWAVGWAAFAATKHSQKDDFRDIDLDETNDEEVKQLRQGGGADEISSPTLGLCVVTLRDALSSLGDFRGFYERLSDLAVKHYMTAGQSNSAESILGDLAALKYELGDYAAAAMYFSRMAPQFAETRWNFVETTMLKMYAQCLKKLNRKDEYTRTLLDLLAKSAAKKMSIRISRKSFQSIGIPDENAQSTFSWLDDDKADTTGLFNELLTYSEQLPYDITVPMSKYFGDIAVEPYVRHYDDRDGFQLRLQVRHILEDDILIERARIHLIHVTPGQGKEMWLDLEDTMLIRKGLFKVWLDSNINTTGSFIVDKIVIQAKKIVFLHEPIAKPDTTTPLGISTPSITALKIPKKSRILCFPRMESFQAKVALSHFIHIDRARSIEIRCSSGWNEIKSAEFRLRSASAGLRLRTANAEVVSGNVVLSDTSKPGVISIEDMPKNSSATLRIPYELENILPELSIRLEIDYVTEQGQFVMVDSSVIPIELPLDVNVHDHFKGDALFSRFNIKTAGSTPLEVLNVKLDGSEVFDVQAPRKITTPLFVYPKQPVSVTYKITTKGSSGATSVRNNRGKLEGPTLGLTVDYRCLDEAVLTRAEDIFAAAVEGGPLRRLGRLLVPAFVDRLEHKILLGQFEKTALLGVISLGSFEDLAWSDYIESLPTVIRDDTRNWLKNWHDTYPSITLGPSPDSTHQPLTSRTIVITVAIPQTHVVHTASLRLIHQDQNLSHTTIISGVGKPLMAELRIKHTRRWAGSPDSLKSAARISDINDPIDFVYDLEANPDVWLVAGQRRAHFSAREGEVSTFPVMLLPLRAGNLLLPGVDIRVKQGKDGKEGKVDGVGGEENLTSETDFLSHGETVLVIPDLQSTTVGLHRLGPGAGSVLLESEGRAGEI